MGIERKYAWATAIGGPGFGAVMWALSGLNWVPPHIAYWVALIGGGLATLVSAALWTHIAWLSGRAWYAGGGSKPVSEPEKAHNDRLLEKRRLSHLERMAEITANAEHRDTSGTKLIPNWGLRDLFLYVCPDVIADDFAHLRPTPWDEVARQVLNRLSTGEIAAWGSEEDQKTGVRYNRAPIQPDFWQRIRFSYGFLTDATSGGVETYSDDKTVARYADVRVNEAQVKSLNWDDPNALRRGIPLNTPDNRIAKQVLFDAETMRLAGLVRAIAEVAGGPGFRLPLADTNPFVVNYRALEGSTHVIWIVPEINQLRRDFLHECAAIGDAKSHNEVRESLEWSQKMYASRDSLIKALTGIT